MPSYLTGQESDPSQPPKPLQGPVPIKPLGLTVPPFSSLNVFGTSGPLHGLFFLPRTLFLLIVSLWGLGSNAPSLQGCEWLGLRVRWLPWMPFVPFEY